jgi:hypothetical protein
MSLKSDVKKRALDFGQKAVEKLMSDDKRAMQIASAIGSVQRGKKAMDKRQAEVMRALNFAPQSDFKVVGKKLSALKRRLRDLEEKVDALLAGR